MSDWDTVTVLRKRPPKASQLKSEQAVSMAKRNGVPIETSKRFNAATNKQHSSQINAAKLDNETEVFHHATVGLELSKLIQQSRQAKGMTQKELATKICEKIQVVTDYESGRAIPNQQILAKMERVLGVKLRGKDKGEKFGPKK